MRSQLAILGLFFIFIFIFMVFIYKFSNTTFSKSFSPEEISCEEKAKAEALDAFRTLCEHDTNNASYCATATFEDYTRFIKIARLAYSNSSEQITWLWSNYQKQLDKCSSGLSDRFE